jgi:plasminogen activator
MSHRPPARTAVAAACALALLALGLGRALAFQAVNPQPFAAGPGAPRFSVGASLGMLSGTGKELVFDYPRGEKFKTSELTWEFSEVAVAGVQASAGFGGRLRVNAGVWAALDGGSASMVDRDWLYGGAIDAGLITPGQISDADWTHESRHPDTSVDSAVMLDLNLTWEALQSGAFALRGIAGYKQDALTWSARGGTFVYSVDRFRDRAGRFPDVEVIRYEQVYRIPYLGVAASWSRPAFSAEAHLLASAWVSAEDTDHHRLRDTVFTGEFSGGTFVAAGVSATWAFSPRWYARAAFESQSIPEITGDVTMDAPEGRATFGSGGGVALDATLLSAEVGLRF